MVEFALVAFALYMLVAAMLDLGRAVFAAQSIQTVADTLARELAVAPLPGTYTFQEALDSTYVRARIFDERALVVDLSAHPPGPALDGYFSMLPVVNQMLRPVMITDTESLGYPVLRYPGAVVLGPDGLPTVLIPRVVSRSGAGAENIEWLRVVEEVLPAERPISHFGIDAPLNAYRGLVSVRVNYPYQAVTLTAFQTPAAGGSGSEANQLVEAKGVAGETGMPLGYATLGGGETGPAGPYSGEHGLGKQYAWGTKQVRPWRKLLSAQAVRRREITLP